MGQAGKKTAYFLNHEQHHFDITYINAMMFIKKLQEEKLTRRNYSSMIQKYYTEVEKAMTQMQKDYDEETSNSQIVGEQERWNEKIDHLLASIN